MRFPWRTPSDISPGSAHPIGSRVRLGAGLLITLAVSIAWGCAGEPPAEDTAAEAPAALDQSSDEEVVQQVARRRFLPDEMLRPGGGPDFPHDQHPQISCTECHDRVRGHGSHSDLGCAACHATSAQAVQTGLSRADCMSCHHAPDQGAPCSSCHETVGLRTVSRSVQLGVWPAARTRTMLFDHVRHEAERCNVCHERRPSLAVTTSCSSCHEDHHHAEARCMSCHQAPPSGAHDLQSHLSCTGSGCHSEPGLNDFAQRRSTCLVCHQAQERHEPGLECADCHRVRGDEVEMEEGVHP